MKIKIADIPYGGLELDVKDDSWFPGNEIICIQPVKASLFFEKKEDYIVLDGHIQTLCMICCDRCLVAFEFPLQAKFRIFFELGDQRGHVFSEEVDILDELDSIILTEPEIPLFEILREQTYLALPVKALCNDECLGLCPHCGVDLNKDSCICKGKKNSPFYLLEPL